MKQDILSHVLDARTLSELGPGVTESPTADEIYDHHDRLGGLAAFLPDPALTTRQRKAQSGYLFRLGPTLVLAVSSALTSCSGAFPGGKEIAASLRGRLRRAHALHLLERMLTDLARRAGQLALCDQAGAVRDAMAVITRVRKESELGVPGSGLRWTVLAYARSILDKRNAPARQAMKELKKHRAEMKKIEEETKALEGK